MRVFSFIFLLLIMVGCSKDDPEIPNEEELITTLQFVLTPTSGGDPVTFKFTDLDGEGGDQPSYITAPLTENTTYSTEITLLNEAEVPVENITLEVAEEDIDHQFFYQSTVPGVSVIYKDQDANGSPLGLNAELTTQGAGSGVLTITLIHQPVKDAAGVSAGNPANAQGETDIEVMFTVNVQ